ncbi:MAG TPA: helix-turn-helix domain-containing protein [Termitinemataceae bacterium]|nr:helix-turn-helix domain-containing protein [Termitinemataceae bacterium]HOM22981.1 helix-turn-helix domain-containing protein [Termitinemataceae bacterium]HPQ00480.1 helix-turn-helix domain-containing protein [Termitinemataceae bacterium]
MKETPGPKRLLLRYLSTNLFILIPAFVVSGLYFFVSSALLFRAADEVASTQLENSVNYVDRTLSNLEKLASKVVLDYRLNRYSVMESPLSPLELYRMKELTTYLSMIVLGGDFLDRCMLYLKAGERVLYENGIAEYSTFYGNLLSVEGFTADSWRRYILAGEGGRFNAHYALTASTARGGRPMLAHFLVWPIGYGDYVRGSLVIMINGTELGRRLARIPDQYGGWIVVYGPEGKLIAATSDSIPIEFQKQIISVATQTVAIGTHRYKVYSRISSYNGWHYVAFMDEERITASVRRVQVLASFLLGGGFLFALALSFLFASHNSRPISHLFSLLMPGKNPLFQKGASVFTLLEEAVLNLRDTNLQLAQKMDVLFTIGKDYLFHRLLKGEYRDRRLFIEDCRRFSVFPAPGPYYVIVGQVPFFMKDLDASAVLNSDDSLVMFFRNHLAIDEYALSWGRGYAVAIKRCLGNATCNLDAEAFIEGVVQKLPAKLREEVSFGVGRPVEDPFLLSLSLAEAETALASLYGGGFERIRFYTALPAPMDVYRYPMDVEASLIRSVLAANLNLFSSIWDSIYKENFVQRNLSVKEGRKLIQALCLTTRRLAVEFPPPRQEVYAAYLDAIDTTEIQPLTGFKEVEKILRSMTEERCREKRSHNEILAQEIQEYIETHFQEPNLSLTLIADTFHLSESYLSSFFKEQRGENISWYILRRRMTEARRLLLETRESVDTIALHCGYVNKASFRRAFKRMFGLSPSEYRSSQGKVL